MTKMSTITSLFIWQTIGQHTRNERRILFAVFQTINYEVRAKLEKPPFFINLDLIFKLNSSPKAVSSQRYPCPA